MATKAFEINPSEIDIGGARQAIEIDPNTVTPTAIAKDTYKEVPLKIRFLVEGAPNMESKIATLKKFYPKVKQLPDENFLVTDAKGVTHIFDDREKTNWGDFIDASKEIAEIIGSTVGAIGGTMLGGAPGTIAGSGLGLAAGAEIYEQVAKMYGTEMLRTNEEHLKQRSVDVAFGSVGQAVAPIIFKGAKYAITGGAKQIEEAGKRLAAFVNSGVQPSLGQVTLNRAVQTTELWLGNIPGASGKMANFAQKAQDDFGKRVANIATRVMTEDGVLVGGKIVIPDETVVGKVLQKAVGDKNIYNPVNSADSWTGRFNSLTSLLYSKVDDYVPKNTLFTIDNTLNKLKNILNPVTGAEVTSKELQDPFLQKIFTSITKDLEANGGKLSYEGIKNIRSEIGSKISENLIANKQVGNLKQLYASITSDIENNVLTTGGTKAMNALRRANRVWEAGTTKLEDFLQPIFNKANPDLIVRELMAGAREGATRLNALKTSFKPEQYKVLISSIIDRMGRISPGQGIASEIGEEVTGQIGRFSSETFLTNWNKLSPAAKQALFSGKGFPKTMVKDMNDLVKVSSVIRESGKTFKNPSGTADRLAAQGVMFTALGGAATGNPAFLAVMPLVMAGANVSARLLTNPRFVSWAAQATKIAGNKGIEGVMEHLTKLGMVAASSSPEEREALFEYIGVLKKAANKTKKGEAEIPMAKKVSEAPKPSKQEVSSLPTLDRSMFSAPSTSVASTTMSSPTTAQGLGSIGSSQFSSLFPEDTLGTAIAERRNA